MSETLQPEFLRHVYQSIKSDPLHRVLEDESVSKPEQKGWGAVTSMFKSASTWLATPSKPAAKKTGGNDIAQFFG